jgi:hypothetical protein
MPIVTLQRRHTEVGRTRLGQKVPTANGRMRPAKLETLRFTSPRRELIERIAELYGGEARPWSPGKGNSQWEVITDAKSVPVMVPPQDPAESQWLELWSAGGCQRRCDGVTETLSGRPCMCDPDPQERDCTMHTRVTVLLEEVPGIGVWRVDTGSYYAATELPGVAEFLSAAGGIIPGRLILSERTVVARGKTHHFVVPVLDIADFTPAELMSGRAMELAAARLSASVGGSTAPAIGAGPDLLSIVRSADDKAHLAELWKRFGADGVELTPELKQAFKETAQSFEDDDVVDAEIVEEPEGWEPQ